MLRLDNEPSARFMRHERLATAPPATSTSNKQIENMAVRCRTVDPVGGGHDDVPVA
jgi:hypothetical protein